MILSILEQISEQKGNKKVAVLKKYEDNIVLKKLWHMTYSRTKFNTSKVMPTEGIPEDNIEDFGCVLSLLTTLSEKVYSGNAQKEYIAEFLSRLSVSCVEVYNRVISGNLRCGIGLQAANKVWGKGFIEIYPVMLVSPHCNKKAGAIIADGGILQLKSDGVRGLAHKAPYELTKFYTRNGEELHGIGAFFGPQVNRTFQCITESAPSPENEESGEFNTDGEFVIIEDGVHNFSKANGIMNKCVLGTATAEEIASLTYMVWDLHMPDDDAFYEDRFFVLDDYLKDWVIASGVTSLQTVPSWEAESIEQVHSIYRDIVKTGNEGVILKSKKNIWSAKRVTDCIKYKEKHPAEFRITGHYKGDEGGEFCNVLGGFTIESECGMVISNTGSGMKYDDRGILMKAKAGSKKLIACKDSDGNYLSDPDFDPDSFIDGIVMVEYNQRTESKTERATQSLRFPIFKGHRFDKSTANTLQEMIEQEKSSFGLST